MALQVTLLDMYLAQKWPEKRHSYLGESCCVNFEGGHRDKTEVPKDFAGMLHRMNVPSLHVPSLSPHLGTDDCLLSELDPNSPSSSEPPQNFPSFIQQTPQGTLKSAGIHSSTEKSQASKQRILGAWK